MAPQSIVITGCTSGSMGFYLAMEFAKRGLHVFATARSTSHMKKLEDVPNVTLLALDITSPDSVVEVSKAVGAKTGGRLDYLLNNAGRNLIMPALDVDINDAKAVFEVNFWGPLRMIQAFSALLIEAKGTVVNIGSTAGVVGTPFLAPYASSKAALECLGKAVSSELQPFGVNVLTAIVGAVRTSHKESMGAMLPEDSRYLPIQAEINERFTTAKGFTLMDPEVYAKQVAADVLGGTTGKIWRGSYASMIRIVTALFPQGTMNKIFLNGIGMEKLKQLR